MDKRLKHSADYYLGKLSAYAANTVDYKIKNTGIDYKINSLGHPTVVEQLEDGKFKIYRSSKVSISPLVVESRGADIRADFHSIVTITSHNIQIDIYRSKFSKIVYFIWSIFAVTVFGLLSKSAVAIVLIVIFLSLFLSFIDWYGRRKFKSFIVLFMNSL